MSREHFAWTIPFITYIGVLLLALLFYGRQRAVDDFLKPDSLGLLTLPIIGVVMYVYNVFRAAAELHEEQMTAIGAIEQQSKQQVSTLERRIEELTNVPDPLTIDFEPGAAPFEETHSVAIGIELGGMRTGQTLPLERTRTLFRVRVENTSASDLQSVSVRLSFEPERPRMSNLSLHLMHDNPANEASFQRSFVLSAFDHRFVDVVLRHSQEEQGAHLCHTVQGVEDTLPVGSYNVVITARASGIHPKAERFTIDVLPLTVLFRKRDA